MAPTSNSAAPAGSLGSLAGLFLLVTKMMEATQARGNVLDIFGDVLQLEELELQNILPQEMLLKVVDLLTAPKKPIKAKL